MEGYHPLSEHLCSIVRSRAREIEPIASVPVGFCCMMKISNSLLLLSFDKPTSGILIDRQTTRMLCRCPSASLDFIVEPWFMGAGADSPAGQDFKEWQEDTEAKYETKFAASLDDLPPPAAPRLALISGRTADNPHLLTECIARGSKCIYLEKPGAPTVAELQQMKKESDAAGVEVLMGYNKNVCKYVRKTREFAATVPGSQVTFVSNNAYENTPESLGECFERNAEGMLKNMAIHELALLVSFYDVSVENIESVTADKEFSSMQTLKGPSGKEWTDFDKIKFTIKTKNGNEVSVQADRYASS